MCTPLVVLVPDANGLHSLSCVLCVLSDRLRVVCLLHPDCPPLRLGFAGPGAFEYVREGHVVRDLCGEVSLEVCAMRSCIESDRCDVTSPPPGEVRSSGHRQSMCFCKRLARA